MCKFNLKLLVAAFAMFALSSVAFATQEGGGQDGSNYNTNTNSNSQSQSQSQTANGGSVSNVGNNNGNVGNGIGNFSPNASATIQRGAVTNNNKVDNTNVNINRPVNINKPVNNNTANPVNNNGQNIAPSQSVNIQDRLQAPAVSAPALSAGSDTCMGSTSVGGSGVGFGFSLGSTWVDSNCMRLRNAKMVSDMGDRDVAKALLCTDPSVAAAYAVAGKPCLPGVKTAALNTATIVTARPQVTEESNIKPTSFLGQ